MLFRTWADQNGNLPPVVESRISTMIAAAGGGGMTTEQVQDIVGAMLTPGANVTLNYNDAAGTLSITSSGSTDPEIIRDTMATALVAGGNVTITPNDAGDTITIAATAGGGADPFGGEIVDVNDFTGANVSAKYRDACTNYVSYGKPIVRVPSDTTLDAGANNPFLLPTDFHTLSVPGPQDEFGGQGTINIRHTGSSSATPATHGVFKVVSGSGHQKFTGISFKGTATTRAWVDCAQDASEAWIWEYMTWRDVSWNQFESVFKGLTTGFIWDGITFHNNFAATRPIFDLAGSDFQMHQLSGFAEMADIGSYSTRRSLTAMYRFPNSNGTGPSLYITGSPTTPFRIDNFNGQVGVVFSDTITEGRPSPGTVGGDTPTDGLHCAGALYRITGGYVVLKGKHYGYAMRDPVPISGFQPGGFIDIRGTSNVAVIGGVFNPYVNTLYPAWTRPDGVAVAADVQPPLAWVSGASARASFTGIVRGPNATSNPVVFAHSGATVSTDGTVTVTTV